MSTTREEPFEAEEVAALLPWYAAGTLDVTQAERVAAAIARDPGLARQYDLVREEMAATIHLNETLGAPSPRAMADLFTRIDHEPVPRRVRSRGIADRIAAWFAGLSPRTLGWASAVVALAILAQAGVITGLMLRGPGGGEFQTASAPENLTGEGTRALIRFAPDVSVAAMAAFLEHNRLAIESGPAPGGLYRVRVAKTVLRGQDLTSLIDRLRQDPVVTFLAPADQGDSRSR